MGKEVFDTIDIIRRFYREGTPLYDLSLRHGEDVARKAVAIARRLDRPQPDIDFIREAAILHDIAIFLTDAEKLGCTGRYPYICHGYLGRELLEGLHLPRHAMVCERHVGIGITADNVRRYGLPLPERDMVPVSIEEKIICYADKFFSKIDSGSRTAKSMDEVLRSIASYGQEKVIIFQEWMQIFGP
jgi:uncharacterized protein